MGEFLRLFHSRGHSPRNVFKNYMGLALASTVVLSAAASSQYLYKRGENYGRKDLKAAATELQGACRAEVRQPYWNWKPDEVIDSAYEVASLSSQELIDRKQYAIENDNNLIGCMVDHRIEQLNRPSSQHNSHASSQSPSVASAATRSAARSETERKAQPAPPVSQGRGAVVPTLRQTKVLEAHNPAGEATQCLELITSGDYDARGVRSNMGAVFRNKCAFPVETIWCVGEETCAAKGYDNLATMPANQDKGISYDAPKGVRMKVHWGACRSGFASRADLRGTLFYACK